MRSRHVAAAFLVMLALWQIGSGLWIPAKALIAQALLRDAWAATANDGAPVRPWPWADTWPIGRLRADAHGVDLIVLAGASGSTLAFGPGHLDGSALPGEPGTIVVSGHRDTHFRFLESVREGDAFELAPPGRPPTRYVVTATEIVDMRDSSLRLSGADSLVLVTCYPFDAVEPGGPLRYVVVARPVPDRGSSRLITAGEVPRDPGSAL